MIKIDKPIIVEGKYDKITLENVIDGLIIPTDGFGIFKNKEKCDMLRTLAARFGLIVMTDSDSAGNMIRAYIKKIVGDCEIINVYVPRIEGKEKRKSHSGKEGILGVEGMSAETLQEAFKKCGAQFSLTDKKKRKITKTDFYLAGLSGRQDSSDKRKKMLGLLGLPQNLSANAMLDVVNTILTYEEFLKVASECQSNQTES